MLSMCFLTFFNSEKPIFFPDITYSFYKVWADLYRIPYECQKLDENFKIIKEDYYKENGGVIFPNPNAPTGLSRVVPAIFDTITRSSPHILFIIEDFPTLGLPITATFIESSSSSSSFSSGRYFSTSSYFSMGHMMWGWPLPHWFDGNHVAMGLVQLLLAGIVMVINQKFFISGFKGLLHRAPNMDTLVALGSSASFLWSTYALFVRLRELR